MSGSPALRRAPARRLPPPARSLLPLALLLAAASPSLAAGWSVEPSAGVGATLTDNHRLTTDKQGDLILQPSAGIRLNSNTGRLRGFLDYSLTGLLYANHSSRNTLLNALSASGTGELVERHAFVDLRASISQQAISAFGTQSVSPNQTQDNVSEVKSLTLSPYLRGKLAGLADYELRLSHDRTDSGTSQASDSSNTQLLATLSGGGPVIGWNGLATRDITDFDQGRRTETDRVRGGLTYTLRHGLMVGVNAGRESNDLLSLDKRSSSTWGVQANWMPSPRTSLAASYEHRFFGESHSVVFSHRTPRTVWSFVDSRDVSVGTAAQRMALGSIYDLFFTQFASVEPDPVARATLVRNFLQTNGIDPNAIVIGGFLASAATLQRTQALSFALVGARNTLTFRASRGTNERLDAVAGVLDDLSEATKVRQHGLSVDLAHRLTPLSSLNLTVSRQRTTGTLDTQANTLESIAASWSTRIGPRSNLLAGVRHVDFDSSSNPYTENAVFATFQMRF